MKLLVILINIKEKLKFFMSSLFQQLKLFVIILCLFEFQNDTK